MKVLFSSHGAGLYGAERVLSALASGLRSRGFDVEVELPHEGPLHSVLRDQGLEPLLTYRARLPRNVKEFIIYVARAPIDLARLWWLLRNKRCDVVWVNSIYNPLAALAARLAGKRIVWHLHERNFPRLAGWLIERFVDRCADVVVLISEFVADSFSLGRARAVILPNALLTEVESAKRSVIAEGDFVVGYVGQLEPRKRAWDVVRAVAQLSGVRVVLVGDGKDRKTVEQAVSDSRLEGRVYFAGFQRKTGEWYSKFDCLVIPSRDEPFGLVALEGMAAGLPIVAAASGALPEVLGDAALYFPPGDSEALSERIRLLREDSDLRRRLRDRALARVSRYSRERFLDGAAEIVVAATNVLVARPVDRPVPAFGSES